MTRWRTRLGAGAATVVLLASCASPGEAERASNATAPPPDAAPATEGPSTSAVAPDDIELITLEVGAFAFDARAAGPADGTVVLLLHGFPESSYEWRHHLPVLAAAGYRAVAPDQRGYSAGARPPDIDDYAVTALTGDVLGMADALGAETFHLVGHDWGAAVAWNTALVAPERVTSLTAVSVPHPGAYAEALTDPEGDQSQSSGYIDTFRAPGAAAQLTSGDNAFLRNTFGAYGEDVVDAYVSVLGTEPAMDAALNYYRASDPRETGPVPPVTVPTLFVWGADDAFLGQDSAELTEQYVDAPYRFVPLDGVGHWIPEDEPDLLADLLVDHLTTTG